MHCQNGHLPKVLRYVERPISVATARYLAVPSVPPLARKGRCLAASWMTHRSRMFGGSCRLATVRSGLQDAQIPETAVRLKTDENRYRHAILAQLCGPS